jgi:hypothetical protein
VAPGGPTIGQAGLQAFGFFTDRKWIWIGVAYDFGFTALVNFGAYLALKYYSGQQRRASVSTLGQELGFGTVAAGLTKGTPRAQSFCLSTTMLEHMQSGTQRLHLPTARQCRKS